MMSITSEMQKHVSERDALLERASGLLLDDPRIVAAWLHGSVGRGTQDEWSDLDLWIVVADDQMETVRAERHAFVSGVGKVLLTIEAPQNAPPGGAYLLAMYPGGHGPHILDCSWQPQSSARRPADTVLLFERASVPLSEPSSPRTAEVTWERASAQTRYFWMMTTVVAKYIARRAAWDVLNLLSMVSSALHEVEWLVGVRPTFRGFRDHPDFAPPIAPAEQLAALRGLIAKMSNLMTREPSLRDAVSEETVRQIALYCALVEQSLN
jgi:hypothetical protein